MDDVLLEIVVRRLEESPLAEGPTDLLLAALDSEESLSAQLEGHPAEWPHVGQAVVAPAQPVGAYLRSLTVGGFRGIGKPATLNVPPTPGLTVVVGRNGSGKSSFAEALEVLLTGELRRWEKLSAVWHQGWRNVHDPDQTEINAEFLVEGAGLVKVQRTWTADASLTESSVSVQVSGEKKAGLDRLGWTQALTNHRPFLAHADLEAFFGDPSGLYKMLASVLGLEDLASAQARLSEARRTREKAFKEVKDRLPGLIGKLKDTDDERARICLNALNGRGRHWDLAAAEQATTVGVPTADGGELDRLRRLTQLAAPAEEDVRKAETRLREAARGLDAVAGTPAGQARALAALLTAALQHHEAHGDGDCPVCGRPEALTAQWQQDTRLEVARLNREAQAAEVADGAAVDARRHAIALLQAPPSLLSEQAPPGVDLASAQLAWQNWVSAPDAGTPPTPGGLRALAGHLSQWLTPLVDAVRAVSARAIKVYSEREDAWTPVAAMVSAWCTDAEAARQGRDQVVPIKAAEDWLKAATDDVRNARLAPIAEQARSIWSMLRQESNVDLGAIRLAGTSKQNFHVDMDVSVDGARGSALGVMSQGEVNALALSVFLPRASLAESPFRFLVVDDPVQAMDPAKVDGLARVLEKAAADRQVIVFTHDNRLPEAIRHLRLTATVLEVTRRPGSVVGIRPTADPVTQALGDARALILDKPIPDEVARRVVPGLCRTAVEAVLTEAVWSRELRAGRGHAAIEDALEEARVRLNQLAALALTGDRSRAGDVLPRLNSWGRPFADTYRAVNEGAHGLYTGDLDLLIHDVRKLVDKIREKLR